MKGMAAAMKEIMNKMFNIMGFDIEEEQEEEFIMEERERRPAKAPRHSNVSVIQQPKKGNIIDIHATTQFQVVVMNAKKFDDVIDIADHLKAKKPVVVNMEESDPELVRRMIDFISGVVYAIDGGIQKISKVILLVTPYNVEIMGDFQSELLSNGVFRWE